MPQLATTIPNFQWIPQMRVLNFNRFLFSPQPYSLNSTLTLNCHSHNPIKFNSLSQSQHFPHSPIPNSTKLGFLLSLSSPSFSTSSINSSNSFKSDANDSNVFNWHRSPTSPESGVRFSGVGREREVVAVVLGWLGARPKHLKRYAEIYNSRGIDALTFVVPVKDVLWFDLGMRVESRIRQLSNELVSWLVEDKGRKERCLIFHTFSNTGWLVYGAILGHLQGRPDLLERIGGCIVDSGGDPELNPKVWATGFATALLKKSNTIMYPSVEGTVAKSNIYSVKAQDEDPQIFESALFLALEKLFAFLFKLPDVNQRLSKIISLLQDNQPQCPQLYLYSKADKVIPYQAVESLIEKQKTKGKIVSSFNFGSSPHVDHYRTFPDVYTSQVNNFLNRILLLGKHT